MAVVRSVGGFDPLGDYGVTAKGVKRERARDFFKVFESSDNSGVFLYCQARKKVVENRNYFRPLFTE